MRDGKWEDRAEFQQWVAEAKRRGLSCGVGSNDSTGNSHRVVLNEIAPYEICKRATRAGQWSSREQDALYVQEAKRRGLFCGINVGSLSDDSLCRGIDTLPLVSCWDPEEYGSSVLSTLRD